MILVIKRYCERIGLCDMAKDEICNTFDKLVANGYLGKIMALSTSLLEGNNIREGCEALESECSVHTYMLLEIVLIYSLPALEHTHRVLGLDPSFFEGVLVDIKAKTIECYDVYKVVGNICYDWYIGFYNCKRACLGRLQLERHTFRFDYKDYKKGERAVNCHIPSTGPLKYDDVIDSFRRAYVYFSDSVRDGILPIVCNSWMLHPQTAKCFKAGGGLEMFYNLFDIIHSEDTPKNHNFWRVFGVEFKDFDKAPRDNSLRKSIYEMIQSGQDMGTGYGVILFDGEKIINK